MADITKTLEIIFNGIDKGVSSTIDGITGKFDGFGKAIQTIESIANPFSKIADYALKADMALAAMVAGGVAASIKTFGTFEETMIRVRGVMGASEEDYKRLTELTLGLGRDTQYTADEAAKGLLILGQAGVSVNDTMTMLPGILKFAQGAMISIADASDIGMIAMKNFGLSASDLPRITDALIAGANSANMTVTNLAEALKYASPVAASLGISLEDTTAIIGKLADAGFKGEMGGTALRNILVALVEPTGNMAKMFKQMGIDTNTLGIDLSSSQNALQSLGVTVKDANGNLKPFQEILDQLRTGLEKIEDPADRVAVLMEIFGKRGGPQMAALINQGAGAIDDMRERMIKLGTVTDDMAKLAEDGMKYVTKILESSVEAIGLAIGKAVKEGTVDAGKGFTDFLNAISKEIDKGSFDDLFELFNELGSEIGDFFRELSESFPEAMEQVDFTPLVDALKNLGGAVENFFDGFDASDPEDVADAIQTVVDALAFLINTTKGMADTFSPVIKSIIDSIKSLSESSVQDQELFGNILGASKLVVSMGTEVVAALAAMQQWGVSAKDVFEVLGGSVKVVFNSLQALFDAFVMSFLDGLITLNKGAELVTFGDLNEQVKGATKELEAWKNAVGQDYDAQIKDIDDGLRMMGEGFGVAGSAAADAGTGMDDFRQKADAATKDPIKPKMEFDPANYQGALDLIKSFGDKAVIKPTVDEAATKAAGGFLKELIGIDENGLPIYLYTDIKTSSIDKAKAKIEEIPKDKEMEIKLKGEVDKELAKIKANAETLQTAMEWKAKLDIANVEAGAKIMASMFESVNVGIKSTTDSISKLLTADWDKMGISQLMATQSEIDKLATLREKEYKLQEKLINQQIEIMKTKNDMMKSGKGLIKIDSTGLEPALETIMWQILQKVQLKANEDSANFLLGIN